MTNDSDAKAKNKWKSIIVIAVIALLATFFIPMEHWSCKIVSGRYVSEASIIDRSDDAIAVRLYNMTSGDDRIETNTFVVLEGNIPQDAHIGQDIRIGYSFDGLYDNPDQMVQVAYREKGSLFTGFILPLVPFFGSSGTSDDLQVVDIQSDGSVLTYNMAK
ncbi:hypothetical protein [Collinsella sp. An307]|uniref:hypothetical protein n=1 Tax=Collinsella sp. An307 TaxID=1965630 RepID=UPI000B36D5FB|nr:hypothetical protein [Collinsella sp. An307]OUO19511.1 hypothetical protein B5F89_07785 [Collinsella sp. An307]